jgi:hypothetical protein
VHRPENQPSRISCASPRALRSVFTGITDSAAFTCRVSRSSTGSVLSRNAPYSHCDSGPASSPIRSTLTPSDLRQWIRATGSLATLTSRTIFPLSSTTHTLELFKDTSIPA